MHFTVNSLKSVCNACRSGKLRTYRSCLLFYLIKQLTSTKSYQLKIWLGKKHLQRPCSVWKLFFKWATFALQPQTQNYSNQKWNNLKLQEVMSVILKALFFTSKGHFPVSKTLVFKMRYLTSSWNRGQGELRKGLSIS